MRAIVERYNDQEFWKPPVRWSGIKTKRKPPCDDCVLEAHDQRDRPGLAPPIKRAAWRRTSGALTVLCVDHRFAWLAESDRRGGFPPHPAYARFNRDMKR